MERIFAFYTDGSALGNPGPGNPGPGGWGFVVMNGQRRWKMSGGCTKTTASEMELVAAIQALRSSPTGMRIDLYSDSQYLNYGITCFGTKWARCGWHNRRGAQILHRQVWIELTALNASPKSFGLDSRPSVTSSGLKPMRLRTGTLVRPDSRREPLPDRTPNRKGVAAMASIADTNSLFEIDAELDGILEEIELQIELESQPSEELLARFQEFCEARGEKIDRIGRFIRMMEAREQFCRNEAVRLDDRARAAANRVERTKSMVMYYLLSHGLTKIEGQQFTLRAQKNSQDSVRITNEIALPFCFRKIEVIVAGAVWTRALALLPEELRMTLESAVQGTRPDNNAIKAAVAQKGFVPGAEVHRGFHLRVV